MHATVLVKHEATTKIVFDKVDSTYLYSEMSLLLCIVSVLVLPASVMVKHLFSCKNVLDDKFLNSS